MSLSVELLHTVTKTMRPYLLPSLRLNLKVNVQFPCHLDILKVFRYLGYNDFQQTHGSISQLLDVLFLERNLEFPNFLQNNKKYLNRVDDTKSKFKCLKIS